MKCLICKVSRNLWFTALGVTLISAPAVHGALMFSSYGAEVVSGSTINVPIKVTGFQEIAGAQFSLSWDSAVLQYMTTGSLGLPDSGGANYDFNTGETSNGKLGFLWSTQSLTGETLADNTTVFSIQFTAIGAPGSSTTVTFGSSPNPVQALDKNLHDVAIGFSDALGGVAVVPEPANCALALFGAIGLGWTGLRCYVRRRKGSSILQP